MSTPSDSTGRSPAVDPLIALRVSQNPIFSFLRQAHVDALAALGRRRKTRNGQKLCSEGEAPDSAFLLLAGQVEVCRTREDGRRTILRVLSAPTLVGLSVVGGAAHTADIVVSESGSIAEFSGAELRRFFRQVPEAAIAALAQLGVLLGSITDELEDARYIPVEERVWHTLSRLVSAPDKIRITHERLADMVGATRPKVTLALHSLQERGVLECGRGAIWLREPFSGPKSGRR